MPCARVSVLFGLGEASTGRPACACCAPVCSGHCVWDWLQVWWASSERICSCEGHKRPVPWVVLCSKLSCACWSTTSAKCRSREHNSWQYGKYQALTAHVERSQFIVRFIDKASLICPSRPGFESCAAHSCRCARWTPKLADSPKHNAPSTLGRNTRMRAAPCQPPRAQRVRKHAHKA